MGALSWSPIVLTIMLIVGELVSQVGAGTSTVEEFLVLTSMDDGLVKKGAPLLVRRDLIGTVDIRSGWSGPQTCLTLTMMDGRDKTGKLVCVQESIGTIKELLGVPDMPLPQESAR